MGEIIGRTACPVCGEPGQNLKINKNGNLYMYCDNRCSTRFNAKESRQLIDELRQGRTVHRGGAVYIPAAKTEEKPIKTTEVKKDDRKQRRNPTDGRTDAGYSGSSGSEQRPVDRLAAWLWGSDELD